MIEPIRILEDGVARIGAGQFDHRIDIATGDEFERLAARFNAMAGDLAVSQERSERIGRLKRFLAPQVAELVDHSGDDSVLDGRRIEVVVVFGDLRGFTAFSARAEPNVVMSFLNDYYDALDRVVIDHGATLTHFSGDGMMVLINAPVSRPDPALCAIRMALDMQKTVQSLLRDREPLDHRLGFGVGLALGPATVGRIGTEGRLEYTAVGSVVNLAARLCASARNAEVLIDMAAADAVDGRVPLIERDARVLKGFDKPVRVFAAGEAAEQSRDSENCGIALGARIGLSGRRPLPLGGIDLRQAPQVIDIPDQDAPSSQRNDAGALPGLEMAVDRFARHPSKGGQFLLRGMDIRAVVGGEHQDASCQSDRGRQECRLLQPADDIAQPGAEKVDQLQRHRRLAIEQAQEVLPRQEEHVGVLHRHSVGSA